MKKNTKKAEKSITKLTKKDKALIIIFSVALAFSMCIFNQFDVFFRNQVEFGIQPQEVFLGFILFLLAVLSLSLLILFLTARFSKTIFKIILAVMLGFMLAGYVQVLFLNNHYNGAFEDFAGEYKPISLGIKILNLCIWIVVCLLPLALLYIEKVTKKDFFKKVVLLASIIIFAMQAVGFATAAPNADFRRYDKSFYLSVDQQLNLSKPEKENIVVFLLDRCATGYVNEVFKSYPDSKDNFEGFTYYQNNISEYGQTFPSVISMLTGQAFEKTETRESFSKRAWGNVTLFNELHAKDYTVNMLIDAPSTYYDLDDISDKIDNITYVKDERKVNQWQAIKTMTKISLQRTLPYVLKQSAGFDYPNDLNNITGVDLSDYFPNNIGQNSDKRFGQKINNSGLSADNQKNTFSFVHLDCSHVNNWVEVTNDVFNTLGEYFKQMKDLGIFENSTIIVTGDHGAANYGREAALFIKEKGQNGGAMKTDNTTKLSNGFFYSTIFELIGAEDKKPTTSYFDIIHGGEPSNRYYYDVSWDVGNHCTYSGKSKIED